MIPHVLEFTGERLGGQLRSSRNPMQPSLVLSPSSPQSHRASLWELGLNLSLLTPFVSSEICLRLSLGME